MDAPAPRSLAVTLRSDEWQFLITVLRASTGMLTALLALQDSMPETVELPITSEAVANVAALADRIGAQIRD